MPSTVADAFRAAGLQPEGVVSWGTRVPQAAPGVYVVSLTDRTDTIAATRASCPLSTAALDELLAIRPELRVDEVRPDGAALAERLAALWLADETIMYIGLAGTSLASRVHAYYTTPLGARRPHAGGWPLKTLSVVNRMWVHFATCADPMRVEREMLGAFQLAVSARTRAALHDPDLPLPFANLEWGKGQRKRHGITGARERATRPTPTADPGHQVETMHPSAAGRRARSTAGPPSPRPHGMQPAGPLRSQRITEKDIAAGRIRFPSSAKRVFPAERATVDVQLRGLRLTARWHPHYDRDQERSGVLSIGRGILAGHVAPDEVLAVAQGEGCVVLS